MWFGPLLPLFTKVNKTVTALTAEILDAQVFAHPCSVIPVPGYSTLPRSVVECVVPPCNKPHTCVDPTVMNNTHSVASLNVINIIQK